MAQIRTLADLRQMMKGKKEQSPEEEKGFVEEIPITIYDVPFPEEMERLPSGLPISQAKEPQTETENELKEYRLSPIIQLKKLLKVILFTRFVSVRDIINILREIIAEYEKEIETAVPPEL